MPNLYPNLGVEVASPDSNTTSMTEYISVGEALKLVTPFRREKEELLAFIANVDTAFEVINSRHEGNLFKFVLTRISGEPRTAIAHRNLENWEKLSEFLKNTYTEKRTLDYHANQCSVLSEVERRVYQNGYSAYKSWALSLERPPRKISNRTLLRNTLHNNIDRLGAALEGCTGIAASTI
jgi:hypothetical protein